MIEKKRVVIITNEPSPYRVEHYSFLQKNYSAFDFHIIFASKKTKSQLRQWDNSTEGLCNSNFLPCYSLIFRRRYDDREINITYGVSKMLKKISPEVVVCMEYNPTSIQTMMWCLRNKIPFVSLTDGTLLSERNIGKMQKASRKFIMKYASAFIASSTKAKEKIESYNVNKKIFISYLSTDISKFQYKRHMCNDKKQILFVGSLIERKGVDLLIRAFARMTIEVELVIAGDGPLRQELEQLAKQLFVEKRVRFVGYKQYGELIELYQESTLFVLPTREDCYGLVMLEAMCSSLPVIASKYADGAYDLITINETGAIVDPFDACGFADVLDHAISINSTNNVWGIKAYTKASEMSFENVSRAFIDALYEVLR